MRISERIEPMGFPALAVAWLRSLAFNVLFFGWTILLFGLLFWWLLPLPARYLERAVGFWSRSILVLARVVAGLSCEIQGREHLPAGPCIIACQHQSAWDTFIFFELFARPVYVVKPSLMRSPFYGWYAHKIGMIPAYEGGPRTVHRLLRKVQQALAAGRPVIIFPQGERVRFGGPVVLKPGVALLAARAGVPVIPAVLDSGRHWGKRSFLKWPGRIVLRFLPAVALGGKPAAFLADLQEVLAGASARLEGSFAVAPATGAVSGPS